MPACLDQSVGDQQNKSSLDSTLSPFSDLYNMVKQDLATKPVWKSANTPLSMPPVDKQDLEMISSEIDKPVTAKSAEKKRRSSTIKPVQTENLPAQVKTITSAVQGGQKRHSEVIREPGSQKTPPTTPQKFTADQVAQQIVFDSPSAKSPKASISQIPENQTILQSSSELAEEAKATQVTRTSPRTNAGKRLQIQDVLQAVVATPTSDKKGKIVYYIIINYYYFLIIFISCM